jgi:hypothetical protein
MPVVRVADPDPAPHQSEHLKLLNFDLMRIRIQLFTATWIRIQLPKIMRNRTRSPACGTSTNTIQLLKKDIFTSYNSSLYKKKKVSMQKSFIQQFTSC